MTNPGSASLQAPSTLPSPSSAGVGEGWGHGAGSRQWGTGGQHPAGTPSNQRCFKSPDGNTSQTRVLSHLRVKVRVRSRLRFRVNASPGASVLRLRSVRPEPKNVHLQ